jgi:hypothetical protein
MGREGLQKIVVVGYLLCGDICGLYGRLFMCFTLRVMERLCMVPVVCVFLHASAMYLLLHVGGAGPPSSTIFFRRIYWQVGSGCVLVLSETA